MLAICSDLDETPDPGVYWQTMRFLNTTEATPMGPGVGLEVGNSIYFDMPPGQLAYWNTDDAGRAMLRTLLRSGHIDCLHSFGDLAATRRHAGRALDELARHDCRVAVWVDHAVAPSNLGSDIDTGLPAANGATVLLRVEFIGVNPTIVRARAWLAGTPEPTNWRLSLTDSTAAEQSATL